MMTTEKKKNHHFRICYRNDINDSLFHKKCVEIFVHERFDKRLKKGIMHLSLQSEDHLPRHTEVTYNICSYMFESMPLAIKFCNQN